MPEYTLIFGIILISGYFTFRLLNHFFGYYREKEYIDKVLEYALFGIFGFLSIYYLSRLLSYFLNKPFNFENFLIIYIPLFLLSSLIFGIFYQLIFGYKTRKKKMSLFERYHMKYRGGWVIIHLKNGEIFYGRLAFTDVDYESERFIFSIDSAQKLNEKYKIIKKYETTTELVFNIEDIILIEYIKEKED